MGSFSSILKMMPGMANMKDLKVDDKEFVRIEAIICSMTKEERKKPQILNASRRIRIAKGSRNNSTKNKSIHENIWNDTKNDEKNARWKKHEEINERHKSKRFKKFHVEWTIWNIISAKTKYRIWLSKYQIYPIIKTLLILLFINIKRFNGSPKAVTLTTNISRRWIKKW